MEPFSQWPQRLYSKELASDSVSIIRETTLNDAPHCLGRGRVVRRLRETIMTTNTADRNLLWVALAIIAALVIVPIVGMMGTGPMMGGMWGTGMWDGTGMSGWMFVIGIGMQLLVLAIIVGGVYLGYRALTTQDGSADPAVAELRAAYARGDLSDDEYERRRERLETER